MAAISTPDLATQLVEYIKFAYSPDEKIKENKGGGYTLFFKKASKPLCYIDINEKKCLVTVVIGASLVEKVKTADISAKAKEMFSLAKQYHDGRWLSFDVTTSEDVNDIKTLLSIKRGSSRIT